MMLTIRISTLDRFWAWCLRAVLITLLLISPYILGVLGFGALSWAAQTIKGGVGKLVTVGPFVDTATAATPDTTLSITQADVWLFKNGGAPATKNQADSSLHAAIGFYPVSLNSTDTDTNGTLDIAIKMSGSLIVWRHMMVIDGTVYDADVAGTDKREVDAVLFLGTQPSTSESGVIIVKAATSLGARVTHWKATLVATHTAGYPAVTIKDGTGTGEIDTASGHIVKVLTSVSAVTLVGAPVALDGGAATIAGMLTKMADDAGGTVFDAGTDSLAELEAAIVVGFPSSEHADVEPGGGTIVTGTNTALDGDSTWLNDGAHWQIAATAAVGGFGLNVVQTWTLGITTRVSLFSINANETLVGVVHVWAYNYTTTDWDQLSDAISAISGTVDNDYSYTLLSDHQQTGDGEVQIRYTSTDTAVNKYLYIDQALISTVTSGPTAADYADAVWSNRFGHDVAHHVPKFTGKLWYVDATGGSDTNPGDYVHGAFQTIGKAIAVASAGDRITVKAGTYTGVGLNLNLAGLELHGEIGAIIDPATGSALTISATHCYVTMIEVRPAAGEIGFDVAAGSDRSRLHDVTSCSTGGTGMKIDSATSHIVVTRSQMCKYTSVGVELNGQECVLDQVVCRGGGGAETGYLLNHANADRNLLNQCASIDNATLGYGLVVGADDNMIQMCTSSAGDGGVLGRDDAGANNSWRGYIPGEIALATLANGAHGGAAATLTLSGGGLVADITGNLSGSVGSVTGAVGSVTGAVGSVTGNVGGNVVGSVASVTGAVGSVTGNVGGNVNGNVVGSVASVTGAVGSVTGAVGSVTGDIGGNVTGTLGGMTAAALAQFFTLNSGSTYAASVAGSVVKEIADNAAGAGGDATAANQAIIIADVTGINGDAMRGTDNAALAATALSNLIWTNAKAGFLTGDAYARLGAPAGASVSADIAAVKADTAAILSDTGTTGVIVSDITAAALARFFTTDSGSTYAASVAGSVVQEIADNATGGAGWTAAERAQIRKMAGITGVTAATTGTGIVDQIFKIIQGGP